MQFLLEKRIELKDASGVQHYHGDPYWLDLTCDGMPAMANVSLDPATLDDLRRMLARLGDGLR